MCILIHIGTISISGGGDHQTLGHIYSMGIYIYMYVDTRTFVSMNGCFPFLHTHFCQPSLFFPCRTRRSGPEIPGVRQHGNWCNPCRPPWCEALPQSRMLRWLRGHCIQWFRPAAWPTFSHDLLYPEGLGLMLQPWIGHGYVFYRQFNMIYGLLNS